MMNAISSVFYPIKENLYEKERRARYGLAAGFASGKIVLEIGCGARDGAEILSRSAVRVVAIDRSPEAIEFAKERYHSEKIEYLAVDCLGMNFGSGSFEVVVSLEVVEHLADEDLHLGKVAGVLNSGGIYVGSTPNRLSPGHDARGLKERRHVKEYSVFEYETLLRKYFKNVKVLGQFLKKDIAKGAARFRDYVHNLDLLYMRRILPVSIKETILDYIREISGATPLKDIREDDFYFTEANLETARHLIAICEKST